MATPSISIATNTPLVRCAGSYWCMLSVLVCDMLVHVYTDQCTKRDVLVAVDMHVRWVYIHVLGVICWQPWIYAEWCVARYAELYLVWCVGSHECMLSVRSMMCWYPGMFVECTWNGALLTMLVAMDVGWVNLVSYQHINLHWFL